MIPHRMLSTEVFANGLRGRVSACRKRLRSKRLTLKAHATPSVDNELEQVFPDPSFLVTDILDDYPAGRGALIRLECSGAFAATHTNSNKMLPPVEELEVGIT